MNKKIFFLRAQTHPDNKLQALWTVVHKLPKANFDNLSYLIKFFHILSKNHEVNRMSPHNIAIVIAPSLIWTKEENEGSTYGLVQKYCCSDHLFSL